jgi:hypothetical protein
MNEATLLQLNETPDAMQLFPCCERVQAFDRQVREPYKVTEGKGA